VQLVVRRFVAALGASDLPAFEDIAEGRMVGGYRWDDGWDQIRDFLGASRCIDVHSFRTTTERE
jgi:hypothetical protein